jgi:type II secretory pathway pseudopilin PulG
MTDINYLDGLPSTNVSTDGRSGEWKEFAPSHARTGWSFYFADPNWWDGVYPNAVRCVWGNQVQNPSSWSICFWTDDSTTSGVFFKVETRPDWRVSVNSDYAGATGSTVLDGYTRFLMGTITPSGETAVVERYFDTLPVVNTGLAEVDNGTGGAVLFSVSKTNSGYACSAAGPRLHSAFSFPCDDIFSAPPRLLTANWLWSARPSVAPYHAVPAKVGPDIGDFQIAGSGESLAYNLPFYNQGKPHGPERGASFLQHIEMDADATATAIQRRQVEVVEAGAYASAGDKIIPYLPASFDKTELVLTITPTLPMRNVTASVLLPAQRIESLPPRTLRVALDQGSPRALSGMRFFFPTQAADSGSAGPADLGPPFNSPMGLFDNYRETFPIAVVNPPSWADLTVSSQFFFGDDPARYAQALDFWAALKASYESQLADWNDPNSTRTDFSFSTLSGSFARGGISYIDQTYASGNSAAALVSLCPYWRSRNVEDNSLRSFESHTSEAVRAQSASQPSRLYALSGEGIQVTNKGPVSIGTTTLNWWETLAANNFRGRVNIGGGFFGGPTGYLTTVSGEQIFDLFTVRNRNQDGTRPPPFEKTVMRTTSSQSISEDVVLSLGLPAEPLKSLFSNYSATYTDVAQVSVKYESGVGYYLGEVDVEVSLAFE